MTVNEAIKHMKDTDPEWDIHGKYNVWISGGGHRGLWEVQT